MKKREYRHGLNKYKLTRDYIKMACIFVLCILAVLLALSAFFYLIIEDGEKTLDGYTKMLFNVYTITFGPAYTLALPFLCAEANMRCPKTKCWGNFNADGFVAFVFIWGAFFIECLKIRDEWAWLLFLIIAVVASDKFLEHSANLYDLVEYIEAVSVATGELLVYNPNNTNEQMEYQLNSIVKRRKDSDPNFEPIYLQDLEGIAYEEAKKKLMVK
jgi:hypothetical protein